MPKKRPGLSRRELLELAVAAGVLGAMPAGAEAATATPTLPSFEVDAAEILGSLLWAAFKEGAELSSLPKDIELKGRSLSEGPIRDNLAKFGLEQFPYNKTIGCAKKAGRRSKEMATAEGKPISPKHFEDAWNEIHGQQVAALERWKKQTQKQGAETEVMLGGAC